MTIVTGGVNGTNNIYDASALSELASGTLGTHSSTQFTFSTANFSLTGYGTGLTYSGSHPSGGTLTGLNEASPSSQSWSGFSVSVSTLWHAISTGDVTGFNNLFFGGNDTFNMQASTSPDFLSSYGGNDVFNYAGNFSGFSQIDGGAGTDTLNLDGNYFGFTSLSGLTNVEIVHLASGHSYNLGASTATTLTVDASDLGTSNYLNFGGGQGTGSLIINGGAGDDTFASGNGNDTFNGGDGSDTIDYSNATSGITVDLSLSTAQAVGGGMGSDTLNSVENIVGTPFNDTLTGNASDNTFTVIAPYLSSDNIGVDTFNGGGGNDTVSFQNLPLMSGATGVTIDLRTGTSHIAGTDTFNSIENVVGSQMGDTFYGNSQDNTFVGGGCVNAASDKVDYHDATGGMTFNMTVYSSPPPDYKLTTTIIATGGGEGTDTLVDMTGIVGTNYNDTFYFIGAVTPGVDGGAGIDTVSFQNSPVAVVKGLSSGFHSIEILTGSAYNDQLGGDDGSNIINGGAGNDTIYGGNYASNGDGNDTLNGGDGNDVLYGGGQSATNDGNDTLDGGPGNDTLNGGDGTNTATYQDATSGVTVSLSISGAQAVGGGLGTDTLSSIENLIGSSFGDTLTGGGGNNVLTGGDGNDTLDISGGGDDIALGGSGDDTIAAGAALTAADKIDGGDGADTVTLNGNYSAGLSFGTHTMINVETLLLAAGHSYKLTMNDANVAAGQTLTVDASALGAGNALTFNGSHETDGSFAVTGGAGNDVIIGGAGNDVLSGGAGKDSFTLSGGGNDTVSGGDDSDTFNFGAALTAADRIDGGAGADTVILNGDYSAGVTFGAATMVNVETLKLDGGFSYKFTSSDATVAAGQLLKVDGSALGAGDTLNFKGSAETDGHFSIIGGAGNDTLLGGTGNDTFTLSGGGNDIAKGGDGNDTFIMGGAFSASDTIDGGNGSDVVKLDGDYSAGVIFASATMTNVEQISLSAGYDYNLTTSNSTVAAGQSLTVSAGALGAANSLTFDGSHEGDGVFYLTGGAGNDVLTGGYGNDTITGGAGNDIITGGRGADLITPGLGNDTVVYASANQSTGANYDTVSGFNATATDKFDFSFTVAAIDTALKHGALSTASFDTDLAAAVGAGQLGVHHAMLYTPDSGTLAGQTFLVVDANGVAGYQAGADFAIHMDHLSGTLDVTDFI